jgi:hypothetical protein
MSSPISSFSKLSITQNMQAPRGHRRGYSGGKGKGRALPEDDPSSSEESSEDDSKIEGEEALEESTTDITPKQRVFAVDHCRQHGARYAFQIADAEIQRCSIRISATDSGMPTCSCNEEGRCRHIHWLLNQLAQTSEEAVAVANVVPHELISTLGLGNVCEKLHWELREGPDSDSEETQWKLNKDFSTTDSGHQTRGTVRERMRVVRDILATLSTSLTDDYRRDIFESPDDITKKDIFVPHDLEATVSRLLILDDDIFCQFKSLVSNNARASDYFRKMALKAQNTCTLLDQYCEVGPTVAGGQYDLIWCAQTLADIVNAISYNVTERQPLRPSAREEAAKALVSILRMVVKERNHDVYQDLKWPRRRIHGEPQIDRNLYQRLIGSTSRANPAGGNFVINALQDLPEARRFVEDLEEIWSILETVGWAAPRPYLDKMTGLIAQLKGSSGPSSSSGKRPAGSIDRNVKRMK